MGKNVMDTEQIEVCQKPNVYKDLNEKKSFVFLWQNIFAMLRIEICQFVCPWTTQIWKTWKVRKFLKYV
jgi:hypothetical protein